MVFVTLSVSLTQSSSMPPTYLKVTMFFFLTVYRKNWEYSQSLLSEETLPNNSCESPLLPPSLSLLLSPLSLPHFCIFLFWCLVALRSAFDTKRGAVLGLHGSDARYLASWWKAIRCIRGHPSFHADKIRHNEKTQQQHRKQPYFVIKQLHKRTVQLNRRIMCVHILQFFLNLSEKCHIYSCMSHKQPSFAGSFFCISWKL